MDRRSFLAWLGVGGVWMIGMCLWPSKATASNNDRATWWAPNPHPLLVVEWRYIAGRIVDATQDYGFVVSLTRLRASDEHELLVQRQDLRGAQTFAGATYTGALAYESSTATYTFRDAGDRILAVWRLDQAAQNYRLTVTTPELALEDLTLAPQGTLIAEGGDGAISVGHLGGVPVDSDYHADWVAIAIDGANVGVARVDMQGLRVGTLTHSPREAPQAEVDYNHRWFAVVGEIDGAPVWISAWRIEDQPDPVWALTIARGSGAWQVASFTEASSVAAPLVVKELAWQSLPEGTMPEGASMGAAWRLTAGEHQPGDLIDLEVAVPPGQFTISARLAAGGDAAMEEGVGYVASGTVQGRPLGNVHLVVAESTAEFYARYVPLARR